MEVSGLPITVVRKPIKNLHLAVYPPNGRVRIAVPRIIEDDAVRLAIISKLGWIRRQQKCFEDQPRQSVRELITGESHYYLGKRYLLDVEHTDQAPQIEIKNKKTLILRVASESTPEMKEELLNKWYRKQFRKILPSIIQKWEKKTELNVNTTGIKRMKTKWGSCNPKAKRIWLNLELIKKPLQCIEYIIVHEMVHFIEPTHNQNFVEHMDRFMPQWRTYKNELNNLPLAHENWDY